MVLPRQGEGSCNGCSNTNITCLCPHWDILPERGIERGGLHELDQDLVEAITGNFVHGGKYA